MLLFSGLLSIPYLDFDWFYFTWFAFVPLLFAIQNASLRKTYFLGTLAGFLAFSSGMYWINDFINIAKGSVDNINGWLAVLNWLYCSQLIALMLVLFNWLRKNSRIHDFILFPVLLAIFTSSFPMLFSMRLADSQINFHAALQATEFFGVYALDLIIALSNIMIFRFLLIFNNEKSMSYQAVLNQLIVIRESALAWGSASILITLWLSYGFYISHWWDEQILGWDNIKVGIVQPNEVPTISNKKSLHGYSKAYPPEMEMSERLAKLNPDLIIWPEAYPKQYLNNEMVKNSYQKAIGELNVSLMFQDIRRVDDIQSGARLTHYNSSIFLNKRGEQVGLYNKIKRIPFGEYIPLLDEDSWLHLKLKTFLGSFLNQYAIGKSYQLFEHEKVNIIPLICYETTFPEFVADATSSMLKVVMDDANRTNKGTMLVALSNDGWFGSTHQPYQHIMGSVLRSVENRMPLVHVANNGPSVVVIPNGKVIYATPFRSKGGYVTKVPVADISKPSFYSRYPNLLIYLLYNILLLLLLSIGVKRLSINNVPFG